MKITGVIVGVIGVMLLGLGGYLFLQEQLFFQRATQAVATVIENKRYTYTGQVNEYGVQHYYCSVFRFETRDGQSILFQETDATCAELDSPPHYQVGQKVNVYYDPQDPRKTVQIRSLEEQYPAPIAATVAGTLFVLFGLGLFWIGLLKSRRAAT